MYQTIACANDRSTAGIKVSVTWDGRDIEGLATFQLRRKFTGGSTYTVLCSGNVNFSSDLTYIYDDIDTIAGVSYTYQARVYLSAGVWVECSTMSFVCQFEGILIGDETGSWHSAFGTTETGFTLSAKKNRQVAYVNTLSGKFPHRVSNAATNYWTGSCTALWLPQGVVCYEPTVEGADQFRRSFIEWLGNDNIKYLKTSDGKALLVSIDETIEEDWSPYPGLTAVSFEWTQVGEVDQPPLINPTRKAWVSPA